MENLKRKLRGSVVAGVCNGLSDFIGLDVVIVRLLFIFGYYFGSWFLYAILWVCMPVSDSQDNESEEDTEYDDSSDEYDEDNEGEDDEDCQIIKPDSQSQYQIHDVSVFLAGSIELGIAEEWQDALLNRYAKKPITFYNPRREMWDPNTVMRKYDKTFNTQVNWELDNIRNVDITYMYFDPNTKSGITIKSAPQCFFIASSSF